MHLERGGIVSAARRLASAALPLAAATLLCAAAPASAADPYQPAQFDLSPLPAYEPAERVTGVLRIYGTPLEALVGQWANAFRGHHGQVRLNAYLINTSQAFAGLVTGSANIGLMGHRQWRNGFQAFRAQFGYAPLEIRIASGSYDDPAGTTPGLMFIVNRRNPLAGLTLAQIDGIYGAQRTGGWVDGNWSTAVARGPEQNIRSWDQLGLGGEWAGQPIHLYGSDVTLSNWADLIERECFQGGTKWNPALIEAPRADIGTKAQGKWRDQQVLEAVANDPYAIGFIFQRVINAYHGDVRVLPLAARAGGPFVAPGAQTFFDGSYPLHNGAYLYLNRVPGYPLGTREKEFVKFILSREGQQILADSRLFIPLNAEQAKVELAKLE
jgi:phosphate transport system substrate-binding protein